MYNWVNTSFYYFFKLLCSCKKKSFDYFYAQIHNYKIKNECTPFARNCGHHELGRVAG